MNESLTIEASVDFRAAGGNQKRQRRRQQGKVPRLSRIMALAIRLDGLVRDGVAADYADLARLGHVTRARVTQIMNLLHLAPDIQEAILFLPEVFDGRAPVTELKVRPIAAIFAWKQQRRKWKSLAAFGM